MTIEVKICGLRDAATLAAALAAGADYVGFVVFPPSPRHIEPAAARELVAASRGRAMAVALVVDADDARLDQIMREMAPDMLQLHGSEPPARVAEIRARYGRPVMKAIKVETADDAARALDYRLAADLILFDAKAPAGATLPGGNGIAFDWRALLAVRSQVPFMLSGGLTPQNVAAAIQLTGATRVDVSSGVESRPGEKDPARIAAFIKAAKAAGV